MGNRVDISVVIPARNAESTLGTQLDAMLAQKTAAVFEIVIADNGSTDRTVLVARSYGRQDPRVRLVDASSAQGINVARNAGIRNAGGRFILLTDADDRVHPGWIEAHWRAFSAGAQCVGGGFDAVLPDGRMLYSKRELWHIAGSDVPFPVGANCGFSVEAFDRVGGFDESYRVGCTEVEFFWRMAAAGFTTTMVPGALIDKGERASLRNVFMQHYRYGRAWVRLSSDFGQLNANLLMGRLAGECYSFVRAVWRIWEVGARRNAAMSGGKLVGILGAGVGRA